MLFRSVGGGCDQESVVAHRVHRGSLHDVLLTGDVQGVVAVWVEVDGYGCETGIRRLRDGHGGWTAERGEAECDGVMCVVRRDVRSGKPENVVDLSVQVKREDDGKKKV